MSICKNHAFCSASADCVNRSCWRLLTPEDSEKAKRKRMEICYVDFKDEKYECVGFIGKADDRETQKAKQ